MNFKNFQGKILLKVLVLFITLSAASYLLVRQWYVYLFILIPVITYQVINIFKVLLKIQKELDGFAESIRYRDFSRHYDVKHAPYELQPMQKAFSEINTTLKNISKEKETQHQYLQKILELVDTGILSYEEKTSEVVWMNESLKKMMQLPYLKTIHSLEKRDENLYKEIITLKPGLSKIASANFNHNSLKILLSATAFQIDGIVYKLIAFQNVNEALDETESKAWQKLLSVMTHEIMNSIAPISSLADTLKHRLQQSVSIINNDTGSLEDLELGIDTIKRRSEGLLKFAETYRNLNKITTLNLKTVYVRDIFGNLLQLMQPSLEQKNIEMETILKDPEMQLNIDINLVEQLLINLVVNAIEALKNNRSPKIILSAYADSNLKLIIKIADNGTGMPPDLLDKIFIPFFSTKKNGSGIGLSLCKQIMLLHGGNIRIQSVQNEGSAFFLQF